MQALIDFDGWRKWKDFSKTQSNAAAGSAETSSRKISGPNHSHKNSAVGKGGAGAGSGSSLAQAAAAKQAATVAATSTPVTAAGKRDKRMSSNPLSTIGTSGGDGMAEGEREGRRDEGRGGATVAVA